MCSIGGYVSAHLWELFRISNSVVPVPRDDVAPAELYGVYRDILSSGGSVDNRVGWCKLTVKVKQGRKFVERAMHQ